MSTMGWELPATTLELPVVVVPLAPAPVSTAPDTIEAAEAPADAVVPEPRRRTPTVLAATLPALLLLGVCVAGLSDPPDAPGRGTGSVSRLHVPRQDPTYVPSVPLHR